MPGHREANAIDHLSTCSTSSPFRCSLQPFIATFALDLRVNGFGRFCTLRHRYPPDGPPSLNVNLTLKSQEYGFQFSRGYGTSTCGGLYDRAAWAPCLVAMAPSRYHVWILIQAERWGRTEAGYGLLVKFAFIPFRFGCTLVIK